MFLNVGLCAGGATDPAPKTPEILNSLISLTAPPLPPTYAHYQSSTTELLSPDGSTPGDESGGTSVWSATSDPPPPSVPPLPMATSPSPSLLTPTSDDSPFPGGQPPDLGSPVTTVEATRSALIKEGLKLQITSKLQQSGLQSGDIDVSESKVIKSELTPEDEERRRKRRERNKLAATKCRNKKKEKTYTLITEAESVEDLNIRLKSEFEKLTAEKEKLERCLNDAKHKATCKYIPKNSTCKSSPFHQPVSCSSSLMTTSASPLHAVPTSVSPCYASPTSSSPSYCSSTSPCSFNSLLSPTDNKDFVSALVTSQQDCFHSTNLTSVPSTSLDYIEPTIPLEPVSSPTKLVTSKCKASPRYHPYPTQAFNRMDAASGLGMEALNSKDFDPAGPSSYTLTTLDIKTNPFTYPTVPGDSNHLDELEPPKYTALETAKLSQFRNAGPDKSRAFSGSPVSRYSAYPLNQQTENYSDGTLGATCNQYPTGNDLEYFPPCTYSNL